MVPAAATVSAAAYSLGHGGNDAQKTMGLSPGCCSPAETSRVPDRFVGGARGACRHRPGTLLGGWRIIHTMGSKITKLQPVGGSPRDRRRHFALRRNASRRPRQHHAHHYGSHHWCRLHQALVRRSMGRRRPNHLGLDPDDPCGRNHLCAHVLDHGDDACALVTLESSFVVCLLVARRLRTLRSFKCSTTTSD